ncbi:MAG: hypothetical protein ACLUMK_05815 [Christensenellales bacterium]
MWHDTMEGQFPYTRDRIRMSVGEISLTAYAKRGTKIEMQVERKRWRDFRSAVWLRRISRAGRRAGAGNGADEQAAAVVVPAGTKGEVGSGMRANAGGGSDAISLRRWR